MSFYKFFFVSCLSSFFFKKSKGLSRVVPSNSGGGYLVCATTLTVLWQLQDILQIRLSLVRVSRSLEKGQGGIQKKGTWCALSHSKRAHSVHARAMRKRQKGYFQYNVEKH